jgi:glutathione gamma-glutamylcysteinyltransferase
MGQEMGQTLYRRPLPGEAIAFSSREGRQVFAEALRQGLTGYFPLAEQFHTQSDPSFSGLGSLVVTLNALAIDPERLRKGPWRWFAEDLCHPRTLHTFALSIAGTKTLQLDLDARNN